MSGVKHTPGPWEIIPAQPHEEIDGAFATFASIEGADGMPVCVFGDCSGSATMFENEADYLLIAAAPDLLEALEAILNTSGARKSGYNSLEYSKAVDLAENALSKATAQQEGR